MIQGKHGGMFKLRSINQNSYSSFSSFRTRRPSAPRKVELTIGQKDYHLQSREGLQKSKRTASSRDRNRDLRISCMTAIPRSTTELKKLVISHYWLVMSSFSLYIMMLTSLMPLSILIDQIVPGPQHEHRSCSERASILLITSLTRRVRRLCQLYSP